MQLFLLLEAFVPLSLRSAHDFVFILDDIFGSGGFLVRPFNLFILLVFELDLAQQRI